MHNLRSAIRAGKESKSISEAARTVSIPSALQVRITRAAISPRLAIRMRRIGTGLSLGTHPEQDVAILDECSVLAQNLHDLALHACGYGVHQLHDLDDPDHGVLVDSGTDLHERRLARPGCTIKNSQQGTCDFGEVRFGSRLHVSSRNCPRQLGRSDGW